MARAKRQRRARGSGSIFPVTRRGRRVWVGRVIVGRSPTGKPVYREVSGDTQREVVERMKAVGPPDPDTITVAEWAARWRETLTVRPSTRAAYAVNLDTHVLPVLGPKRLAAVTATDIESLIARLLSDGGVAPGTARNIVANARTMFQAAVRSDLIVKNPVAAARKPRHDPGPVETYTPAELSRIITTAPRFAAGGAVAALAATGMRLGEAVALDVADYDSEKGTLSITKTYTARFGIGPPKSRYSRRVVTVPDLLFPVLDAAVAGRTTGPLFPTLTGARRPAQTVSKCWRSVVRAAGLTYKKPHTLRHSVATALIGAGVPLPDVARYMGDTVATLVRFYVHPTWADPALTLNLLYGVRKVGAAGTGAGKPQESGATTG
jgi:integrase